MESALRSLLTTMPIQFKLTRQGGEQAVRHLKVCHLKQAAMGRNQRLVFGPSSANLCSGAMFIDTVDERRCPSERALLLILILRCIPLGPYRIAAFTGWIDLE